MQTSNHLRPFSERSRGARWRLHLAYGIVGLFFRLTSRLHIAGAEHISEDDVVLASNHISLLDTLLIPYSIMTIQGVQFISAPAKAELFRLPIFGRAIASLGAFPVRRGRGDLRAIRRIEEHMRTGKLMLFPEGTRSLDGCLGKGKRMVGKLIYDTRPVVVPAAIWGTNQVWPSVRRLFRCRPSIGIRYGQPLDLQQYYTRPDTKETAEAIVREVMGAIAMLLEPDESSVTSVSRRHGPSREIPNGSTGV
ncbi:MAG: lysophospholipid acyltransferase family protein [bacterium]|nr:lysophospholipid acyltransferase family protein [bacterium]